MEPISRVDQVLLLLRQQLAERAAGKAETPAKGRAGTPREGSAAQPLYDVIARRLAELKSTGLTNRGSLTRLLLEEILTAQFGQHLLNEAKFQRMVADIQSAIESDEDLRKVMDDLLADSRGAEE